MQKKLIALAVAGLVSGAAFAQTNVTVYGVVDVGYQYSKSEDNKFSGIESGGMSGSRFGFRTTEALGNGLSAIAQAEFGFAADKFDKADGAVSNLRNAWVGLKHDQIGAFTAGRQHSVAYDWVAKGYASDITVVYPSNILTGHFVQMNSSDRVDNSVKYASPNWAGFEVRTVYGFGEKVSSGLKNTPARVEQDTSDLGKFSLGGAYKNGPVDLALIYAQTSKNDADLADDGAKAWSFGGSFDFKVVKVFGQYQQEKNKVKNTAEFDLDQWTVGARVPVAKAGTVVVEYVRLKKDYEAGVTTPDGKAAGWGVGYEHAFSKRTTGYAAISRISHDDFTSRKNSFGGVQYDADASVNSFGVGLRHTF